MKRVLKIWNSSLATVGIIGVLILISTQFLSEYKNLLLFGQLVSITSYAAVFFYAYILILKKITRNVPILLLLMGSAGAVFGLVNQLVLGQVYDKPPIIHVASTMISVGLIINLNKALLNGKNIQSKL